MIHLIYISSATSWPSEDDLMDILSQSRQRNMKQNVTGLLVYDNATYMQVLEGSERDVYDIYASIQKDSRSTGNVILLEEEISQRDFPEWSMGFKDLKKLSPDELPGYEDIFKGNLDKETAVKNPSFAYNLLFGFANKV